jgi:MoaA/NifB/PqqE/SkfB family radical SAM enzyme
MRPLVDLIWNMTLVCPYDCAVCCVDAVHVSRRAGRIELRSEAGASSIPLDSRAGSIFEQAGRFRQSRGLELDLAGKRRILDHLEGFAPRLDFSGGDALVMAENVEVIREAAARFGREAVTVTATSAGVSEALLDPLASTIGHFNFTYDGTASGGGNRPPSYASANLEAGRRLARAGVSVRAELPLSRSNVHPAELTRIYEALRESGVGRILVMRLFPVGRGADRLEEVPSRAEYLSAIRHLRDLEATGGPRVRLQCALRHLEANGSGPNPCNAVTESFGIAPDGTFLRSAWAIDRRGKPLDPSWVLGNIATTPLARILDSPGVREMRERADENRGHCKVFAFLNGSSSDPADRFYEKSDPLYAGHSDEEPTDELLSGAQASVPGGA